MIIRKFMTSDVITVTPDDSVADAISRMEQSRVGGLPVVGGDDRVVGIITSRDVRRAHPNRLVADAMTRRVVTIAPDASVWEAQALMERAGVERLPVVESERLVGIVTRDEIRQMVGRLTDDLTGLPTSSYLRFIAERSLATGQEICLIFLDLNDFGALNKRFGHAVGDLCLRQVAKLLSRLCDRETDALCRYGGDEFALVTPLSLEAGQRFAEALVDTIGATTLIEAVNVTASAGVVGGRRGESRDQNPREVVTGLINLASQASTEAKASRRKVQFARRA